MNLSLGFFSLVIVMMPSSASLCIREISVLDFLPQRYSSMIMALLCLSSMILLIFGLCMML